MSELKETLINISEEIRTKLIPENLKSGVQIFGITGNYTGGVSQEDYDQAIEEKLLYYNNWQETLKQVDELEAEIEPLVAEIDELQAEILSINGEGVPR